MSEKMHISKRNLNMIILMVIGAFLGSMNQMILGPALPSIMADLQIDAASGQWLTTIFLLINGIMIPCTAYLMARFTTRDLYLLAMLIFGVGSLCAGFSHSFAMLLLARVLQALGFGILMPLLSATVLMVVPISQRGKAMGLVGLVFSIAPAVAPSAGGLIVDLYGWNAVFLVFAPLIFIDIIVCMFIMPKGGETTRIPLDKKSVLMSTVGFGGLLYGFSAVGSFGWTSAHVYIPLVVGAVVVYLFVKRQGQIESPLLRFDCMKNRRFATGLVLSMVVNAALLFGGVLTPIYLQDIHGFSAFQAALIMLPVTILAAILQPVIGNFYDKNGGRFLMLSGIFLITIGSFFYVFFDVNSPVWFLVIAYSLRMLGVNITIMPITNWCMTDFTGESVPHANAVLNTMRQIAGSVGTAIFVSVYMVVQTTMKGAYIDVSLSGIHTAFGASGVLAALLFVFAYKKVHDNE